MRKISGILIFIFFCSVCFGDNISDLRKIFLGSITKLEEGKPRLFKITETLREKETTAIIDLCDSVSIVLKPGSVMGEYIKLVKGVALRRSKKGDEALKVLNSIDPGSDEDLKYHKEYNAARIYIIASDYNNALGYLLNNLDYFAKHKKEERQQVLILGSISNCYRRMKMFDKCKVYVDKAIEVSERTKDTLNIFDAYSALAILYLEKLEYQKADSVYAMLEGIVGNLKNQAKESFYNNYAETCINLNQMDKAEKYINECYRISCLEKDTFWIAIALINKGNVAVKKNDFSKARDFCKTGFELFVRYKSLIWLKNSCQCLYESNLGLKNYKEALEYYKSEREYTDSILSEKNHREMTRKDMQYEFDRKEAEVRALARVEKEKTELKASEDRKRLNLIITSVVAVLIIVTLFSILIFRSLQKNKRANKIISVQKQLVEEKQKEILDSIVYAKRIQQSLLPTEKYMDKNIRRTINKG